MNHYIFLTDEGYTFEPDSDGELKKTENLQVIGFARGTDADEAYRNLLSENSFLKDTSFEEIFCYQLDKDYEQSRKDYNLRLDSHDVAYKGVHYMKQHEAVILAMKQNGGYATLGQLYQTAPKIPGSKWGTKTPFATIRRIVQEHNEFFKIRPGLWALASEKDKVLSLFSVEKTQPKDREYSHYFFQGLVAEIGKLKGFQTFIPAQDKNKPYAKKKLGDVATLSKLYEFTYSEVLRKAQTIDVAWFNVRRYPNSFFEIEHSTDIYNSLLKFMELQDFRTSFYIVADSQRQAEFDSKISSNTFSPIKPFVKFWNYDLVVDLHAKATASKLVDQALL